MLPDSSPPAGPIIEAFAPADTYALRRAVLWPAQPPAYVVLPDDDTGQHFGVRRAGRAVAVISLFVEPDGRAARFRKFAVAPAWQGRGLGTALLRHVVAIR